MIYKQARYDEVPETISWDYDLRLHDLWLHDLGSRRWRLRDPESGARLSV